MLKDIPKFIGIKSCKSCGGFPDLRKPPVDFGFALECKCNRATRSFKIKWDALKEWNDAN